MTCEICRQKSGRIEIICGSMFSGKTTELIRRAKRFLIAGRKVIYFKPSCDERYGKHVIKTHEGVSAEAINIDITRPDDMFQHIELDTDVVVIDEIQLYVKEIVRVCNTLADRGIIVIGAGLDLDYEAKPFGHTGELLAIAEKISKIQAVCDECGQPAYRSFRKSNATEQLRLGGKDEYSALCRACYVKAMKNKK